VKEGMTMIVEIFLMIILVLASIWDAFATVYGTLQVLGDGTLQIAASLLFGGLILGFVLNSRRILKWRGSFFGGLLKLFWFIALCYDFLTTWIANRDLLGQDPNSVVQIVILIGLTLLVSASPILLTGLWEKRMQKSDQPEQVKGYS
jgi:hypothetical protein